MFCTPSTRNSQNQFSQVTSVLSHLRIVKIVRQLLSSNVIMALPISALDLINKNKIESSRLEFKSGWNPDAIYRSICAFANDIDNLGGGYILVGVEEENGIAKRPVKGLNVAELDRIQKGIVGFNNLIEPFYAPKLSIEEIDGKQILVIWIPAGANRPYKVPERVTSSKKERKYFIRYGSSSIEARGDLYDELRELNQRIPFDDRGNPQIQLTDISVTLLRDHLVAVKSRLANDLTTKPLSDILEQMDLMTGPSESRLIKNVAAMMFCETPEKFFRTTRIEIVTFPEGRENNPNLLIEAPYITGPVPRMIRSALDYLKTNVIKEQILKPKDDARSERFFNYPYQALEEAVVNALYHRDYRVNEPVEITIEPHQISIISYTGPDRAISLESLKAAKVLNTRRYRNRRLGDFLKELDLTEGRATGIPTIQRELKNNGSPTATIQTDNDRTFFLINIPCHPFFYSQEQHQVTVVYEKLKEIFRSTSSQITPQSCKKMLEKVDFEKLLGVLKEAQTPRSSTELENLLHIDSRYQLRTYYLIPLLRSGLIELTIKDKPNSSKQRYKTTERGLKLLID